MALPTVSSLHDPMASHEEDWRLKGAKEAPHEGADATVMILDTACTKPICSRYAFRQLKQGLSDDQVELLPDASTFNFANGQEALAREKCRIWFFI